MGMVDIARLKGEIALIVGRKNVSGRQSTLRKNSTDATGIRSEALLVVYPQNGIQVLELVRLARRQKIGIVPRGGGSGLAGGAVAEGAIVLNMTRMDGILALEGRSVTVQPGVFLDDLNRKLKKRGMLFPVRPASHAIATLGGMISTNAGGEHVLRYGKTADNVLEVQVVSGDGRILRLRGKGATDFCGTEGILGIVVEARLRIVRMLKKRTITVRRVKGLDELAGLAARFAADRRVIACEFINPKMGALVGESGYFMLAEFAGDGGEISKESEIARYWKIRESCNKALQGTAWTVISDPQIPPGGIRAFLRWCEAELVPAFGHIGHGIIHVRLRHKKDMKRMYGLVNRLGGRISGEHGIGITKKEYLEPRRRRELKRLKRLYDPGNIMNRGKVI